MGFIREGINKKQLVREERFVGSDSQEFQTKENFIYLT